MNEPMEEKTRPAPHTPAVGSRDGIYRYPPSASCSSGEMLI